MTDQEESLDPDVGIHKPRKYKKDNWDKAEIVFKFMGAFLAAGLVALVGFYGNRCLQNKQKAETNIRLYTQLLSNKETAENLLRKDMFDKILSSFVNGKDENGKRNLDTLSRIREMRLHLELLSRNFHESLDMKPLFKHLLMEIICARRDLRSCLEEPGSCGEHQSVFHPARQISYHPAYLTNEQPYFAAALVDEERSQIKERVEKLLARYNSELDLLIAAARRVARKQHEVLEEVADELKLVIPLKGQPADEICTEYRPTEWLPKVDGKCKEKATFVKGISTDGTLT